MNVSEGIKFHVAFIWIPSEELPFEKVSYKMQTSLLRIVNAGAKQKSEEDEANHGGVA